MVRQRTKATKEHISETVNCLWAPQLGELSELGLGLSYILVGSCVSVSMRERDLVHQGVDAMKRWIMVFCLILISSLGVLVPAGAQASTVAAGQLTSGKPVKATISAPGQSLTFSFAATAKKNVTFNVTHFSFTQPGGPREVFLVFYEPGSSTAFTTCDVGGSTYCNFTTPVGGTWSVVLVPYEANVGSLTLTFANDVPTRALTPGVPVTTTTKFAGQRAGYTFAATAKRKVTFNVTHFSFAQPGGPNEVFLVFYKPGSSTAYATCDVGGTTACPLTTPVGAPGRSR
jgi:hypothetical protein